MSTMGVSGVEPTTVSNQNIQALKQCVAPTTTTMRPPSLLTPAAIDKNTTMSYNFEVFGVGGPVKRDKGIFFSLPRKNYKSIWNMGFIPAGHQETLWNLPSIIADEFAARAGGDMANRIVFNKALAVPYQSQIQIDPDLSADFSQTRQYGGMFSVNAEYTVAGGDVLIGNASASIIQDSRDVAQSTVGTGAYEVPELLQACRVARDGINEESLKDGIVSVVGMDIAQEFTLPNNQFRVGRDGVYTVANIANFSQLTRLWAIAPSVPQSQGGPVFSAPGDLFGDDIKLAGAVGSIKGDPLGGGDQTNGNFGQVFNTWVTPWNTSMVWNEGASNIAPIGQLPYAYYTQTLQTDPIDEEGVLDLEVDFSYHWDVTNPAPQRDLTGFTGAIHVVCQHHFSTVDNGGNLKVTRFAEMKTQSTSFGGPYGNPDPSVVFPGQKNTASKIAGAAPGDTGNSTIRTLGARQFSCKFEPRKQYRGLSAQGKYIGSTVSAFTFFESVGDLPPAQMGDVTISLAVDTTPIMTVSQPQMHQEGHLGPAHIIVYKQVSTNTSINFKGMTNNEAVSLGRIAPYTASGLANSQIASAFGFFPLLYAMFISTNSPWRTNWTKSKYEAYINSPEFRRWGAEDVMELISKDPQIARAAGLFGDLGGAIGGLFGGDAGKIGGGVGNVLDTGMKFLPMLASGTMRGRDDGQAGGQFGMMDAAGQFGMRPPSNSAGANYRA